MDLEPLLVLQEHDLALDRLRHRHATLPGRTPRLASAATTVVISPGVDSMVPRVSVRIGCSVFWRMPS
ncbi:MAG: hypothetical protein ACKOVH_09425, partial [Actinomycetota bacterium]